MDFKIQVFTDDIVAHLSYRTHFNSIISTMYFLDMAESGLVFIILWNKSERCGTNLGPDLSNKEKIKGFFWGSTSWEALIHRAQTRRLRPLLRATERKGTGRLWAAEWIVCLPLSLKSREGKTEVSWNTKPAPLRFPAGGKIQPVTWHIYTNAVRTAAKQWSHVVCCLLLTELAAAARTRQWTRATRGVSRVGEATLSVEWFIAYVNGAECTDAASVANVANAM